MSLGNEHLQPHVKRVLMCSSGSIITFRFFISSEIECNSRSFPVIKLCGDCKDKTSGGTGLLLLCSTALCMLPLGRRNLQCRRGCIVCQPVDGLINLFNKLTGLFVGFAVIKCTEREGQEYLVPT